MTDHGVYKRMGLDNDKNLRGLAKAFADLKEEETYEILERCVAGNTPSLQIIHHLSAGMDEVGRLYKEGDYYLSELVFSGEIFKNAVARIKPLIEAAGCSKSSGTLIMGTVAGDIHDLGKNIVITLLTCAGFEVIDLGVDVPGEMFVETVKASGAPLVGLSTLLTTSFSSMQDIINALTKAGLRGKVKIMIGGSSTSERLKEQIGADYYGRDATDAVTIAKQIFR